MDDSKLIKKRNSFVKAKLRRSSLFWPERNEAVRAARRQRGRYECKGCGELFELKKLNKDHIDPVMNLSGEGLQPSGEYNWNLYIPRLLCSRDNFQLLCEVCHSIKTSVENDIRNVNGRKKKK